MRTSRLYRSLKEYNFTYYWILAIPGIIVTGVLYGARMIDDRWALGIFSALVSYTHFIQRQKLQEMDFFERVFVRFNQRYDRLNDSLNEIIEYRTIGSHHSKIIDYFNLCAEEHLIYQQGFIPQNVWQAWVRGMEQYWAVQEVRSLWIKEVKSGSYYGFDPMDHLKTEPSSQKFMSGRPAQMKKTG